MQLKAWYWGFLGTLTLAAGVPAHASDALLGVAPLRLILSDSKNNDLLTLINRSDKPRIYKVILEDEVMDDNGAMTQKDDFVYSAKRMLRFNPQRITLQPGQRQNVRVMAVMPEGLADGDYHTHLIFDEQKPEAGVAEPSETEVSQGLRVNMENIYSVGIPVIVQHGKLISELKLKEATLTLKDKVPSVKVVLTHDGNSEGTAVIQVVDKTTKAVVTQPRTMHAYHEVKLVTLDIQILKTADVKDHDLEVQMLNNGKIQATMPVSR